MITTYGDPNSPPIVFLHGFLGASVDWKTVADALKESWFCIVPDLPGHGSNGAICSPETISLELDEMVKAIHARVNQPFHLLGYSLGGRLAIRLACEYPELISSLCLESAHPGLSTSTAKEERIESDARWATQFLHEPITAVLNDWYRQPVFESLSAVQLESLVECHRHQNINALTAMLDATGLGRQPAYWTFLAKWNKPLLYMTGEHDKKFMEIGERLKGLCPKAYCVTVRGASHNTHFDQPAQFIQNINSFLRTAL